ncbi:DNA mismatch repair protein MutL [Bacteroidia bacterium]|nr:DNA mismatch repair protein MutL [Bacteroidia bacterium]GHT26512.1 DNA mismatch repair protein MutL [Bacteroidia bacterium]
MSDIIHLLSDSIANQIAAGEVIQRPASVVKELIENAVDAGADSIHLVVKDAGRTLIQVIDNGKGMSETDARMAFERHATSKINSADDLFSLRTIGFRGEALASIAAVAQVELKTARKDDTMGTLLQIAASQVEKQQSVAPNPGSIFSVKNLFFNVPARRKFLKSNETEFKNILTEFERVVLVNPQIFFNLHHNDAEILNLPVSNLRQRILNVFGKKLNTQLLSLHAETSLVSVSGFVGTPEFSRKKSALQYFFVNNRYMRHPYFHKAVTQAFEPFIPAGEMPNYFIYMTVDPGSIDVNIHPAKTEIKFENEQAIWLIITAAVKEAIAKSNAIPSLEFDRDGAIDMPVYSKNNRPPTESPKINIQSGYNPFREMEYHSKPVSANWEKLYEDKPEIPKEPEAALAFAEEKTRILSYKGKYIVTPLKSGLTLINQRRAHIRVLFDEYMQRMKQKQGVSQGLLFPEIISFTPREATVLPYLLDDLAYIGFDLADLGSNSYSINGIPSGLENVDTVEILQDMADKVMETGCEVKEEVSEALALTLAKKAAIPYGKFLSDEEADMLIAKLFASSSPNYTPDGKIIISILSEDELGKRFK